VLAALAAAVLAAVALNATGALRRRLDGYIAHARTAITSPTTPATSATSPTLSTPESV